MSVIVVRRRMSAAHPHARSVVRLDILSLSMQSLSLQTKFAYGVGQVAEGIKTRGFDYIAFFYFTQVLGLSGSLAGLAVAIALLFDAVSDPVAGQISDNWHSKLGRRHPFMYAAALPLAASWLVLYFPPAGLGQTGLFCWFLGFAVLVRASMTLYHVPHMALGAELSDDYSERTSIVQWRTFSGMMGSLGVIGFGIYFFFPESEEFSNGLLNPAGYPAFAIFSSVLMFVTIWYSAWGTRKRIPYLPGPPLDQEPFSLRGTYAEFAFAWQNHSFRSLFVGFSLFGISISIGATLGTHLNIFFWGFSVAQISALLVPTALGFVVGVAITRRLHERFDKKPSLIAAALISGVLGNIAVVGRLAGLMPPPGSPELFQTILLVLSLVGVAAGIGYTSAGSMMADVAQDQYTRTGRAQQGILFSAVAFSGKVGSAGGHFLAGVGIDLIQFPLQSDPAQVAPYLIARLGMLSLIGFPIATLGIWAYTYYRINRASFEVQLSSSAGPAASTTATSSP
jgi:GPH family glycoside/pentoside/hexuronide:cation symporter